MKEWTDFGPGMVRQGGKETSKENISQGKTWRHADPVVENILETLSWRRNDLYHRYSPSAEKSKWEF